MILSLNRPDRIRQTILACVVALFLGYQGINAFVPNADMILATRVLAAGFYMALLYVYGPDAWLALRTATPKRSDFLVVGIWIGFASHFWQDVYSIVYRLAPSEWLLNAEIISPGILLSAIAVVLHVSAPGAVDGTVPRRNRIALGAGVGVATLLVGLLLVTRPDIRPFVDGLRPWIGDFWHTGGLSAPTHG